MDVKTLRLVATVDTSHPISVASGWNVGNSISELDNCSDWRIGPLTVG
jgi:hypothetical protein